MGVRTYLDMVHWEVKASELWVRSFGKRKLPAEVQFFYDILFFKLDFSPFFTLLHNSQFLNSKSKINFGITYLIYRQIKSHSNFKNQPNYQHFTKSTVSAVRKKFSRQKQKNKKRSTSVVNWLRTKKNKKTKMKNNNHDDINQQRNDSVWEWGTKDQSEGCVFLELVFIHDDLLFGWCAERGRVAA